MCVCPHEMPFARASWRNPLLLCAKFCVRELQGNPRLAPSIHFALGSYQHPLKAFPLSTPSIHFTEDSYIFYTPVHFVRKNGPIHLTVICYRRPLKMYSHTFFLWNPGPYILLRRFKPIHFTVICYQRPLTMSSHTFFYANPGRYILLRCFKPIHFSLICYRRLPNTPPFRNPNTFFYVNWARTFY